MLAARTTRRLGATGRIAGAALMLLLWLGVLGAASAASLHHAVCGDSHLPSHECLLSVVAKGQFAPADDPLVVFVLCLTQPPEALLEWPLRHDVGDVRLEPGRAPPTALLHP